MKNKVHTNIIAEIGQAHEGSLGIAHSYIDALQNTGVDAIKWQMHIAEAESSPQEPFRVKFSYEDETRMDYWKRMEFTFEQWQGLKEHCENAGMEFLCSPFSNAAVDQLEKLGVKRYKIGSGEVNNFLLLEKIAKTGKPILLSSGMSSFEELDETVSFLNQHGANLSIFQCTTSYPTLPNQWGLNVLSEIKNRYSVPVGFSDHSGDIYACLAAQSMGAELLEFHVVFDKRMFGPDAKSSLTIEQVNLLAKGVREIDEAKSALIDKSDNSQFSELKQIFEKSLAVNCNLQVGDTIEFNHLESKKPKGFGINANEFQRVIGKKLVKPLNKWDFLTNEHIQ
jgi:N-acetylneuraminate synthase